MDLELEAAKRSSKRPCSVVDSTLCHDTEGRSSSPGRARSFHKGAVGRQHFNSNIAEFYSKPCYYQLTVAIQVGTANSVFLAVFPKFIFFICSHCVGLLSSVHWFAVTKALGPANQREFAFDIHHTKELCTLMLEIDLQKRGQIFETEFSA